MIKAVFLDRDGTINPDEKGYIKSTDDFVLYSFSAEAIKILNQLNYKVFIITNQSGIARGIFTFDDLESVHLKMENLLKEKDAFIDEIFVSPYFEKGIVEPFNINHEDRKPNLGLFKKALEKYNFRINESFMIGDKEADIIFGKKAGLTTILVKTGCGKQTFADRKNWVHRPDYVVDDLLVAAKLISKIK